MYSNYLRFSFGIIAAAVAFVVLFVISPSASAVDIESRVCGGASFSLDDRECNGRPGERAERRIENVIKRMIDIITVIVGVVAVIMIIIGGFKFITSNGDSGNIASARNTIIYALVGLVIVALAQVIVRFVLSKV